MALSIKVMLRKDRPKQDGTYPLAIRITYNRKISYLPMGYSFIEKDFDDKKQQLKSSAKGIENVTLFNNLILKRVKKISDIIAQMEANDTAYKFDLKKIKSLVMDEKISGHALTVFEHMNKIVEELKEAERFGNARAYKGSLSAIKLFRNEKDLHYTEIDFSFLKGFENFFRARGAKPNTIAIYLRSLRSAFNLAIKEKFVRKDDYPFDEYTMPSNKTRKQAISVEDIEKIENFKPEEGTRIWHSRNYFLFSYYSRGMNFSDMAYLRMTDIQEGRIYYIRRKTGGDFSIKIHPKLQEIIGFYSKGKKKTDFLFPIIHRLDSSENMYNDVKNWIGYFNKQLKEIAKQLELEATLNSYVSRHSFATNLKKKGVSINVIKESLGHKDVSITETYLKSFEDAVLDEADDLLFNSSTDEEKKKVKKSRKKKQSKKKK